VYRQPCLNLLTEIFLRHLGLGLEKPVQHPFDAPVILLDQLNCIHELSPCSMLFSY
jgi:hypothetical protein